MTADVRFRDLILATAAFAVAASNSWLSAQPVENDLVEVTVPARNWTSMLNRPGVAFLSVPQFVSVGPTDELWFDYHWLGRTYYVNDQRIEFTGLEATFGVQGAIRGVVGHQMGNWTGLIYAEFLLNQPFDRNLLTDYPLRDSFAHNYEIEPFEISQLSIVASHGNWSFEVGRFVSPFGRYHGTSYQNSFVDTPFIRSEAILFRETGVHVQWAPSGYRFNAALTNGGLGQDTNSSKAFVGRVAVDREQYQLGGSIKWQDGIGSESQKEYKNHIGIDLMVPLTERLTASTEFIYDEYGLRRPGFSLDDINWGRSIYNRQLNKGLNHPLTGWGYYVNLIREGDHVDWLLSYGQFYPRPLGDPIHDQITRRLLANASIQLTPAIDVFSALILENSVDNAQAGRKRKGVMYTGGIQFRF